MDIGALLKTFIYIISSSLLYPVLFLLTILTIWLLVFTGSFFTEWISRSRKEDIPAEKLSKAMLEGSKHGKLDYRVLTYIKRLEALLDGVEKIPDIDVENLLQDTVLKILRSLDRIKMIIRIGPSLGLIGTLIPMGTGLAALSQGDMTKLSADLVIAFTTTVVGLALGMTAYFFYTVKRRWIEEDIKNIEFSTEILVNNGKSC